MACLHAVDCPWGCGLESRTTLTTLQQVSAVHCLGSGRGSTASQLGMQQVLLLLLLSALMCLTNGRHQMSKSRRPCFDVKAMALAQ